MTPTSVYTFFEQQAIANGYGIAVIHNDHKYTYNELVARVGNIYTAILRQAAEQQYIGISTTRSVDMIAGILAILKAGKAYLPLDPVYPVSRLQQLIATAELKYTLSAAGEEILFDRLGLTSISVDNTSDNTLTPPFYNPVACVLFTSGSTGVPKGVCLGHEGLINQLLWQRNHGMAQVGTRTLQFSHLSFDAAFLEIFVPLTTGGTLYLIDDDIRLHAGNLLQFIINNNVERLFLAYAVVQFLAEVAQVHNEYPQSVKEIITGGELLRITPAIANFFKHLPGCTFMNVYGPTETSVWVTELKLKGNADHWPAIPSLGYTIQNMEIFIVDEHLELVANGTDGEILIHGPGVALGYLNNPVLTSERFFHWHHPTRGALSVYRTGDLAAVNPDGSYQFRGRIDTQVKIRGGHRVELAEIEVVIAELNTISQVKVIVREDTPGDRRIIAYAIPSDKSITESDIKEHMANRLPAYMLPDRIILLSEFPYTVSGKIDTKALPAPALDVSTAGRTEPVNDYERQLKRIWEDVLNTNDIGTSDNFFHLGGNSLVAIKVMIRTEKEFGRQLPLASVYQYPTIQSLAALIATNQRSATATFSPIVPLKKTGNRPPVYLIHGDNLNVLNFSGVVQHIHPDQPVYGVQPLGIDGTHSPLTTIPEIAHYYNTAILESNPDGPHAIVGYSFGGYVAFEMVKQLEKLGKKVILLGMIDTDAYHIADEQETGSHRLSRKILRQFPKMIWLTRNLISSPVTTLRFQFGVIKERIMNALGMEASPIEGTEPFFKLMTRINKVHHKALRKYRLGHYNGTITLFKAVKRPYFVDDPHFLGWTRHSDNVKVFNIPGDHSTMLEEPNCKELAKAITSSLKH